MIRLKLTRDQLQVLATCFNPVLIEKRIEQAKEFNEIPSLENLFLLLDLAEGFTKKYYFNRNDKPKINLKYADGAALIIGIAQYERLEWDADAYTYNVLLQVKGAVHQQLINYQKRFYDATQSSGLISGYNGTQKPPYQLTRPSNG